MGMKHLVAKEHIANHATTHLYQRKIGSILYPAIITEQDSQMPRTIEVLDASISGCHVVWGRICEVVG
jgi:hypothetical protein